MRRHKTVQKIIASGFGTGFCPVAPGTMGALLALCVWIVLYFVCPDYLRWITAACVVAFTAAGVWAANSLVPDWGDDPPRVVVDEMAGMWISLLPLGVGDIWLSIGAFAVFRLLDIFKPLGIRRAERLRGGVGVMADDILAGVYAAAFIFLLKWLV